MRERPTILLIPGHGANKYYPAGKFRRPLFTLVNGEPVQVAGIERHEKDGLPGFYREDLGTIAIAAYARKKLNSLGYPVHLTRTTADDVNSGIHIMRTLSAKGWKTKVWTQSQWIRHYAKLIGSNIAVSIHTNGSKGTGCAGFYTYPEGKLLSQKILERLSDVFGLEIRRNEKHRYSMLSGHSDRRTCLIECAFHDHPRDLGLLLSVKGLREMGSCIAHGIDSYAKSVGLI